MTKLFKMHRDEKGITGLETAIILIAFIVVASVFAYTVLSSGLFSSQKTEETIHSGVETGQSTISLAGGNVIAYKGTVNGDECIPKLQFSLTNSLESGEPIDLTPFYYIDSTGALASPMIADGDSAWTGSAGVTAGTDSADYKEEPRSASLDISAAGFAAGLAGYYDTSTMDLTAANQVALWIKSSVPEAAGDLTLLLCTDDVGAVPVATLNIPALPENEWKQVFIDLPDPSLLGAIESVGITAPDEDAVIHLDDVRTTLQAGRADKNVTMVAYDDPSIVIDDTAWTVEFVGGYDASGNYLLENTEKAIITVWLQNYDGTSYSNGSGAGDPFIDSNDNHLKTNDTFNIQIMPPKGATLTIQKTTPAYLSPIMRLY